ncbi:MAG: hypothetical protein HY901_09515 [Deltaproteobacteria bacterium]|nr:hypothetical protein [Deltaproteobacteria bacterium]
MRPVGLVTRSLCAACLLLAAGSGAAFADAPLGRAGQIPALRVQGKDGLRALPLLHTDIRAEVAGLVTYQFVLTTAAPTPP